MPNVAFTRKNDITATNAELVKTPFLRAANKTLWLASSLLLTKKVPIIEETTPTAAITIGTVTPATPRPAATPKAEVLLVV